MTTPNNENSRESIAAAYNPGEWIQFPKTFIRVIPGDHAILMAYLINYATIEKSEKLKEGWFTVSMEKVKEELAIRRAKQTRMFSKLQKAGILTIERRGNPARRWLKINYHTIRDLIEKATDNPLPKGKNRPKKLTKDQKKTKAEKVVEQLAPEYKLVPRRR